MKGKLGLAWVLVAVFALSRWPGLMPENFSAAYGLAFCAGVFFPGRLAWLLPLGTLLVTDVLINAHYGAELVNGYMLANYAAYVAIIGLGRCFTARSSWTALLGGGLAGAILFYLVTNTAAWLQNPEYAKTLAGWIQALTVGTPYWPHTWEFFRNTLTSGGLFTGLFAAAMKLAPAPEPQTEEAPEPEAEPEPVAPAPEESKA